MSANWLPVAVWNWQRNITVSVTVSLDTTINISTQKKTRFTPGHIVAIDYFLAEQAVHWLCFNQFSGLVEVVVDDGVGGNSKTVVDCSQ